MKSERKLKVLVVDDEAAARDGLVRMLSDRSEVVSVHSCANGIEAINAINESHFDLLLLDIQMPLVDGFDVLRSVKKENIPHVVFITAYEHYAVKAFKFHAVDYVLKPFSDIRLHEVIKRVQALVHDKEHSERLSNLLKEVQPNSKSVRARYNLCPW